jgi:TatD DNase family protein
MMGLHPCDVKPDYETEIAQLFSFFDTHTYCAVGEIGIDSYWDKTTQDIQEKAFLMQVEFALSKSLPIAIHSRNATHRIIEMLKPYKSKGLTGVFHCFSESVELAEEILKLGGFKLGIGGVLTYKNAGLPEVMQQIDLQHIILETDSPYLPPVPHRGKRNEPAYTRLVAEKLADVKGVSLREVADITTANAEQLFGL